MKSGNLKGVKNQRNLNWYVYMEEDALGRLILLSRHLETTLPFAHAYSVKIISSKAGRSGG